MGLLHRLHGVGHLEEVLEAQNDNLGNDVASKDGAVQFRRIPVEWVPWFDNNSGTVDTTNPIYGINWTVFKPCFLSGEYMKETKVAPHPLHHRTITQFIDCSYNFFCGTGEGTSSSVSSRLTETCYLPPRYHCHAGREGFHRLAVSGDTTVTSNVMHKGLSSRLLSPRIFGNLPIKISASARVVVISLTTS